MNNPTRFNSVCRFLEFDAIEPVFHPDAILDDEVDSDIEALIAEIMQRYELARKEAIRVINKKMAQRTEGVDWHFINEAKRNFETDCYCCPGSEIGRLFEDEGEGGYERAEES